MATSAKLYDEVVSYQAESGLDLINKFPPAKGSRVLDLGCGTGYLTSVLAERVGPTGRVTGIDPDKERIQLAQYKYGAISNLEFLEGNSEELPSGQYNFVFSNYVMHWIKDKESAIKCVYDSLQVGGRFAFLCVQQDDSFVFKVPDINKITFLCTSDEYEKIAHKCGFVVEFKAVKSAKFLFPNTNAFIDWAGASVKRTDVIMSDSEKSRWDEPYEHKSLQAILVLKKP